MFGKIRALNIHKQKNIGTIPEYLKMQMQLMNSLLKVYIKAALQTMQFGLLFI